MPGKPYVSVLDRIHAQTSMPAPVAPVHAGQYPEFKASYGNPLAAAAIYPIFGALVAAANYFSPTVRKGDTFTAVDNHPAPVVAAAFGDLLRLGRHIMSGPAARTYSSAVLDRRKTPITEKDYTPQELAQLSLVANRAQAAKRGTIQRSDYQNTAADIPPGGGNPTGEWGETVGRANLQHDAQGQTHVVDSYDFNKYDNYGAGVGNPLELMEPALWLGRRALPSGLRSTPVNITLPVGLPKRQRGN